MNAHRIDQLRARLTAALTPHQLDIEDESHRHRGHAGAADGRGHFRIVIVADRFSGMPTLARHRCVYDALGPLMQTDIHALAIDARAPNEPSR